MSIEAMTWVWKNSKFTNSKLLTMLAIADSCNSQTGICWPSMERIAEYARCSVRTVMDTINEAEKAGELEVGRGKGEGGTNCYKVLLPDNGMQNMRTSKTEKKAEKAAENCVPSPRKQEYLEDEKEEEPEGTVKYNNSTLILFKEFKKTYPQARIVKCEPEFRRYWEHLSRDDQNEAFAYVAAKIDHGEWTHEARAEEYVPGAKKFFEERWWKREERTNGNGNGKVYKSKQEQEADDDAYLMARLAEMAEKEKEDERLKQERIRERKAERIRRGYYD